MKNIILLFLVVVCNQSNAQDNYWQQKVYYDINVSLDDKENSLSCSEILVYKNNSPHVIDFIWFHMWPNAYSNKNTALFRQIENDDSRKKKLKGKLTGSITGYSFQANGKLLNTEPHSNPDYVDIIKVKLDTPLKPGDSVRMLIPFRVQLPEYFSRSGYADGEFMICQWYPKPAVYDKTGWHEMPYLDMGEFYSEYGDYKVTIAVPKDYVVAATGELQNKNELDAYKTVGAINAREKKNKPALYVSRDTGVYKLLRYHADNVPDFAWFAEKDLVIQYDTIRLKSGRVVDAFSYYHNNKNSLWKNSIDYIKNAVHFYSNAIGEYEYPVVQAIEGPKNNSSGGMEYPMVTLITSPDAKAETLDAVITHEVGHNWFMSMLGSNERMHTWQDEGMNSYFQFRYEAEKYRFNSIFGHDNIPEVLKKLPADEFQAAIYNALLNVPMEPAIETPAAAFENSGDYGIVSYVKAAMWMYMLEATVGREKVDQAFQYYFSLWKHKHPQPEDMKAAFEKSIGGTLTEYFNLLNKKGKL